MDRTPPENLPTTQNQHINPALLILAVIVFPNLGDYHADKYLILSTILITLGVMRLPVALSLRCWVWYFLINTLIMTSNSPELPLKLNAAIKASGTEAMLFLLLPLVLLFYRNLDELIKWGAIANVAMTIMYIPMYSHRNWLSGGLVNPGMNAGLTAMTVPFLFQHRLWPLVAVLAAGLALGSGSSTGIAATIAAFLALYCTKRQGFYAISIAGLVCIGLISLYPDFLNDSGRFKMQSGFMRLWWENFNPLVGSGGGSFSVWGPVWTNVVRSEAELGTVWMWLHSDALQCLFEYGIIGVILSGWVVVDVWRKGDRIARGSLAALLVVASNYYPTHHAPTAVMISALVFHVLRDKITDVPTK